MNYTINYTKEGKILGFAKSDTDLNIEVSNSIWFEAQSFNKIIIDRENITFEKVDWRTDKEIAEDQKILKKSQYLQFCNETIAPYQLSESVTIDIRSQNLTVLIEKMNGWSESISSIEWLESGNWINLTKVQLQQILIYAENEKQIKFKEIFNQGV